MHLIPLSPLPAHSPPLPPCISRSWPTADSSEQALWNYTLIWAWIYSGVCIVFLFWLSVVFFPLTLSPYLSSLSIDLPTPLLLKFQFIFLTVYLAPVGSHIIFISTFSHFLSLIFFSLAFFPPFTLSLTPNTHFANSVSCSALIQVEWTYCPF